MIDSVIGVDINKGFIIIMKLTCKFLMNTQHRCIIELNYIPMIFLNDISIIVLLKFKQKCMDCFEENGPFWRNILT